MGREIKRVPMNFDWPIDKVWGGFKNPFSAQSIECPDCKGSGSSPKARYLKDQWYGNAPFKPEDRGSVSWKPTDAPVRRFAASNVIHSPAFYGTGEVAIQREAERLCEFFNASWSHHLNADDVKALVKAGRLQDFTHTWTKEDGWKPKEPKVIPTPREVNEWSLVGFGHDSINQWVCVEAECKRLGYKQSCERCNGDGSLWPSAKIKKAYNKWRGTNPPKGKGWQLWETVSEGSPISPVFKTPEELARWLTDSPDYTWRRNDARTTYEQWIALIKKGWCPSFIGTCKGIVTGVQAVSKMESL